MSTLNLEQFSVHLQQLNFNLLFTDVLGWNHPPAGERTWQQGEVKDIRYQRRMVAELAGVAVLEIVAEGGWPDENQRMAIWRQISQSHYENLLIFLDRTEQPTQSLWYWVKRTKDAETGKPKNIPRRHEYFRGQPVDLFASKLQAMVVELYELDSSGRLPVLEVARRMESALDVEKTTKRFFTRYQEQHQVLLDAIEGIDDERDRRWYASVILNRLMFVWFLQKKFFLDGGDADYLPNRFKQSQARGKDRFFGEFLNALFFEAFAKTEGQRSESAKQLTGKIPYLNGGLFLHHKLELDRKHQPRVGITLKIKDDAFAGVLEVFGAFTWHLDDTPAGQSDEINPDVLGYIFEKYINQKAFGAYYTRPEITSYLADRSIHQLVLERVNQPALPELNLPAIHFDSVADMLARMDARTAIRLVNEVLPSISILDPAVGSGAFLVAALKALINIYYAVVGRAELGASAELQHWLKGIQKDHTSVGYYIKRRIVTDNLYGADIMEEACEIAKLRLFLAMVSSVRKVEDLEPLPNIDFNILPGNSLVGLMRVDEHEFDRKQDDLFKPKFRKLLEDKNRKLDTYRHTAADYGKTTDLRELRDDIDAEMEYADGILNELLRDQFEDLGVKYEEATWDEAKQDLGKPKKRKITTADISEQTPLHWGYVFDEVMNKRGGFDIVLTNPPWEVFMPHGKEFLKPYAPEVTINKMPIKEFENLLKVHVINSEIRDKWLSYNSLFPHISSYFRSSPEYIHQSSTINGKKTGSHLNLYKLFTERCFNLVRAGGHCGMVIPSGIYSDEGAKGLRDLLFDHTHIQGLFCFENRKEIFEGVHRSFKFVVLTFEKSAMPRLQQAGARNTSAPPDDLLAPTKNGDLGTSHFPAAFMRQEVSDINRFPDEGALWLDTKLIKTLSPDSHSVMEFKTQLDIHIAEKMFSFPLLGKSEQGWDLILRQGLNMTSDNHLFSDYPDTKKIPLIEGKMAHQFKIGLAPYRYWIDIEKGRKALIGRLEDIGQKLEYQSYRLAFRRIGRNTDERTLIATVLPPGVFGAESFNIAQPDGLDQKVHLYLAALLNGFVVDYLVRQMVTANLSMFFIYQLPVPRLSAIELHFVPIVNRAARLICTTPEFNDLAREIGLTANCPQPPFDKVGSREAGGGIYGVTNPVERAKLRAELDGLIAHLYGLTEAEFAHILTTFPLVPDPVKLATRNAYRDIEKGLLS